MNGSMVFFAAFETNRRDICRGASFNCWGKGSSLRGIDTGLKMPYYLNFKPWNGCHPLFLIYIKRLFKRGRKPMTRQIIIFVVLTMCVPAIGFSGQADVVRVEVKNAGNDSFHFDVTVKHGDTGWDHYADKWEVLAPDGDVVGVRTLHHTHVGEQPFTRSLSNLRIDTDISHVTVRAHDSVHAYGGKTVTVELPR
jgi:hypothetical protein